MADFASIINAIKSSKRTERVTILSAMYAIGGASRPVTQQEIYEELHLRLGKKSPARYRLNSRLRRYSADVRIAEKGPPLRWMLTENGIQDLRDLSSLALPIDQGEDRYATDIGIVCALEHPELAAVIEALGGPAESEDVGDARYPHVYRQTKLVTESGKTLSVIATASTSMGLTAAAIVTTQMIVQFRPRIVLMIGIAGGTRDGGKQFGDVLVADPSVDYASGKIVKKDGVRGFQPDPYPIGLNARVRSVLHKYRGAHPIFGEIRKGWTGAVPASPNRLHLGPLGAADQVIDDAERVVEIQQYWRKLIGIEMETYGVYRACHEAPEPKPRFISFKSVCDFAAEKSDSWQAYAAYMAAAFALTFLKTEWDALWHQPKGS
jgi:nucleoside phosphorylase